MNASQATQAIAHIEADLTGKSLAQVQADTLSDDVRRIVVAQQFAEDWLLVAENDGETYEQLVENAKDAVNAGRVSPLVVLSDGLREDWEHLAEQVTELVREHISETASLFIAQLLKNQGSLPFDIIAREVLERN
jgi:tRNA(Ser,Leu) C12 N-acetylase TAN1